MDEHDDPTAPVRAFERDRTLLFKLAVTAACAYGLVTTAGLVGFGLYTASAVKEAARTAPRLVVPLDVRDRPIGVFEVNPDWTPSTGAWIGFAEEFIKTYRGRPTDARAIDANEQWLGRVTDAKLNARLTMDIRRRNAGIGNAPVYVTSFDAQIKDVLSNGIVQVYCQWVEEPANIHMPPTNWTGILSLSYSPSDDTTEIRANPVGIFAMDLSAMPRRTS